MSEPADVGQALLDRIADLVERASGMVCEGVHPRALHTAVAARVVRGCRGCMEEYLRILLSDSRELDSLVEEIAILETRFFRHQAHFRALRESVLPSLRPPDGVIHIWSAGCATGEEPYSLAISCLETGLPAPSLRAVVLGTDISYAALATAERGEYREARLTAVSPQMRERYFERRGDCWRVGGSARSLVELKRYNLLDPKLPVPPGTADILFCQNVLIYFRPEVTRSIAERLVSSLREGGYLFPGFSEGVWQSIPGLTLVPMADCFLYRKGDPPAPEPYARPRVTTRRRRGRRSMGVWEYGGVGGVGPLGQSAGGSVDQSVSGAVGQSVSGVVGQSVSGAVGQPVSGAVGQSVSGVVGESVSEPAEAPVAGEASNTPAAQSRRDRRSRTPIPPHSHTPRSSPALDTARREAAAGRLDTALEQSRRAVEADPMLAEGWELIGLLQRRSGHPREAERAFRRQLYLEPDSPLVHFHLGALYRELGRPADARREYANAARLLAALPPNTLVGDVTADLMLHACQRYEAASGGSD